MPGQTSGGRWFLKWQNLYTRCDGDHAALPEKFCSLGMMGTFTGSTEVPAGAALSRVLAQTEQIPWQVCDTLKATPAEELHYAHV